ncbi:MAG: serine--tRNA ligase [Syntrophales bacterium]|nr:serine--tRNA ligase [Syntrophales bacterium]
MLDLKFVRANLDFVARKQSERGSDIDIESFSSLEQKRRDILQEVEALRSERNTVSKEVGTLKKSGSDAADLIAKMGAVSARIKELEESLKAVEGELHNMMLVIPNIPHDSVPFGRGSEDNPVVRTWGEKPTFDYDPKPHWELGENLGILDFGRAAKIAGARFAVYQGQGARLERALINFMLDLHTEVHGYREVMTPFMVNRESMQGTGQLPKFEEDLFKVSGTNYFLIPTAEVPVTNLHADEIMDEKDLTLKYVSWSACFRAEAGSYGKDTRGLIRQHQFNKVELVKFARPEDSYDELESLTLNAEEVLRRLGIPYQTVTLCTGDLGFSSAKTYDIEAWMPGQEAYREISSCSNFEDYQARRAGIRFRRGDTSKVEHVHTLNGSGLAVGRTFVAVLENFQQGDGSIAVPEVLIPYMNGVDRISLLQ